MATKTASARVPGSILSPDHFHRTLTTTAATTTRRPAHRVLVEVNDLNTTLNQGATYFAEAQYVAPSEYTWCQAHPTECNMYNNASYRQFLVSGTTNFSFSPLGDTARMQPAIWAWTGATVNRLEPDPGNDGFWFIGYKVTNPSAGVWHYEYALYNMNLDRAIQSFSVPLGAGVNISNIGFHAPPQHPGWPNDGTLNSQGYSSTAWNADPDGQLAHMEHGNFWDQSKCQRDSLGHIV